MVYNAVEYQEYQPMQHVSVFCRCLALLSRLVQESHFIYSVAITALN